MRKNATTAAFLFGILIFWGCGTVAQEAGTRGAVVLREIQYSSPTEIARLIFSYATSEAPKDDVSIFLWLLDNKQVIEASREISVPLEVRDIALVCIEEIAGQGFLPEKDKVYPVKAILAHVKDDGTVARFHFPLLSDGDFERVKMLVKKWLADSPKRN